MKKIIFNVLLALSVLLSGCESSSVVSNLSKVENNRTMTITVLPSPPKSKTTFNENDIDRFLSLINSTEKKELPSENRKGWQILVTVESKGKADLYSLTNNMLRINGKAYEVDGDYLSNVIMKIYDEIQEKIK